MDGYKVQRERKRDWSDTEGGLTEAGGQENTESETLNTGEEWRQKKKETREATDRIKNRGAEEKKESKSKEDIKAE